MSRLILVRHGQAAAFTPDSDALTELGKRQAARLGEYLAARRTQVDEVHTGTLQRQIETEQIAGAAFRAAGLPWPEAQRLAGWNEYDASAIMGRLAPLLSARDERFAALVADFERNRAARDRNRYFQRMFEALMERWVGGELGDDAVEPFAAFHARVCAVREAILTRAASRTVLVFTSGGPIGACVQLAVQAPPAVAVHLNWRVKNGSITEFLFSPGRLSLDAFNAVPHLDTDDLVSFR
jgi:broad specificity phosphatase PhoE